MSEYIWAFIIGGLICAIGQLLIDFTKLTPARILTSYVVIGVFLGATGLYKPIAEKAGAGANVPLTGFGNLISEGVRTAVDNDGIIGILSGSLTAGAAGITTAIVASLIASLFTRSSARS